MNHNKPIRRDLRLCGFVGVLVIAALSSSASAGVRFTGKGVTWGRPNVAPTYFYPRHVHSPGWGWGWGWGGYWDGYYGNRYWSRYPTYDGPPLIEVVRREDPGLLAPDVPAPPPPDEGLVALASGDYDRAVIVYAQRYTDQSATTTDAEGKEVPPKPERWEQRRLMALALVGAKRYEEAASVMAEAYANDATLNERPLNGPELLTSSMRMRRLVTSMVGYAHKAQSAEAWTCVAMLMQFEGRKEWAQKMLDRAEAIKKQTAPAA